MTLPTAPRSEWAVIMRVSSGPETVVGPFPTYQAAMDWALDQAAAMPDSGFRVRPLFSAATFAGMNPAPAAGG